MIVGIIVLIIGFIFDMEFAGIPFQDSLPKMLENYKRNKKIADCIIDTGIVIIILGIITKIFVRKNSRNDVQN